MVDAKSSRKRIVVSANWLNYGTNSRATWKEAKNFVSRLSTHNADEDRTRAI